MGERRGERTCAETGRESGRRLSRGAGGTWRQSFSLRSRKSVALYAFHKTHHAQLGLCDTVAVRSFISAVFGRGRLEGEPPSKTGNLIPYLYTFDNYFAYFIKIKYSITFKTRDG